MRELALFAGAGGGILGSVLLGWDTVCAVEIDPYARQVLLARQRDGMLGKFPIWDDVCTFDGRPWRGCVDVISGGFPCQDISSAKVYGGRGGVESGARSSLWREYARIIREVRPRYVFAENSAGLARNGLNIVLSDLACMGFDAKWGTVRADHAGAPHGRPRLWVVADAHNEGYGPSSLHAKVGGAQESVGPHALDLPMRTGDDVRGHGRAAGGHCAAWRVLEFQGVDNGVAHRMDRIAATGNGQVPAVARLAWRLLSDG